MLVKWNLQSRTAKKADYGDSKNITGDKALESKEEWVGQAHKIQWKYSVVYYTDIFHYTFVGYISLYISSKPIECAIPRVNPKVKDGFCMIMRFQCRFIFGKKYIILVFYVDNKGACGGSGRCQVNCCTFLSIFS